ncbi:MAG: hypothetical protein QNK04_10800 [Myxococcota bacterium]|nr:hypothetical protein [Myxococcota bacterium]
MPFRCVVKGRVLFVIAEGEYGLADVREALDAAIASPDFEAPMILFADARESTANPSAAEVSQTARYLATIRQHFGPTWVLVVRGTLRYGLARMLSIFTSSSGIDLRVHRDLEEGWRIVRELAA